MKGFVKPTENTICLCSKGLYDTLCLSEYLEKRERKRLVGQKDTSTMSSIPGPRDSCQTDVIEFFGGRPLHDHPPLSDL